MPIYTLECAKGHRKDSYLSRYTDPNPVCEECGTETERVWTGRKLPAGSQWPWTNRVLTGKPVTYENEAAWRKAVAAEGGVIRDDASWLHQEEGTPSFNWDTGRVEYPETRTPYGMPGSWF